MKKNVLSSIGNAAEHIARGVDALVSSTVDVVMIVLLGLMAIPVGAFLVGFFKRAAAANLPHWFLPAFALWAIFAFGFVMIPIVWISLRGKFEHASRDYRRNFDFLCLFGWLTSIGFGIVALMMLG